ncbi:hypothetical protein KSS87_019605 [Heliosperma pusillum]|nr:hypothetical protein KSS87_019605 [Heliosperma pusillum]
MESFDLLCIDQLFDIPHRAVAEYISKDLPYRLSESDVCITVGCKQAVHAIISSLATPGSNILLPMPTFSMYDACSAVSGVEVRHYNLLPEQGWEVDLHSVEALADESTVAMVLINPGNPCGSVYTYQHLENLMKRIKAFLEVASDPTTFIQGALPEILEKTKDEFFSNVNNILRQDADLIYQKLVKIPCISCPNKPQGSMFVMVKLDVSLLDDIEDDTEFCLKVAKEEKVLILPGVTLGMKNWLRITFALEPYVLQDGLERIEGFCQKHSKIV